MPQVKYQIDPVHSSAQFSVRHMMIANVRGEFTKISGLIAYDAANPSDTEVDVNIEVSSINTRDAQRDTHLKSGDFFDAEKYPYIKFRSKQISGKAGNLKVAGDLSIRDVTREIVLNVEGPTPESKDPWGNVRVGATATAKLNRKDYGLTWNAALETGGVLVGEEVKITIDIEAIRQS